MSANMMRLGFVERPRVRGPARLGGSADERVSIEHLRTEVGVDIRAASGGSRSI